MVVVGATGGIGRAVATAFSAAGARLLLVARREGPLRELAERLRADALSADVCEKGSAARVAERAGEVFGATSPDIVVVASGDFDLAPVAQTSEAAFDRQVDANLRGPFRVIRAFLPAMLERGAGRVVGLGSVAGRRALPGNGAYAASKYGLRGLFEVLELELRGTGVCATLVEPAATDTGLWDELDDAVPGLPARAEMLRPEDVAEAVLFVATRSRDVAIPTLSIGRG